MSEPNGVSGNSPKQAQSSAQGRRVGRAARARRVQFAKTTLYQIILVCAIFAIWEFATRAGYIKVYLYGQPSGIWEEIILGIADGSILHHTWITAQEAVIGFAIGSFFGSAAGLALWISPTVANLLRPIMVAANGVPKIALAPLIIVWFGVGMESKIAIAAIITFIVALITAHAGTQEADKDLVRLMRSLGASRFQTFTKIVVPGSMPWVVSGFRLNIGFALIGAVVGEYISAEEGLGYLVYYSGVLYNLNATWVGIFALMLLALVMDFAVSQFERRFKWS
jgi:NitT/TauT family transport system permease protein